MRSDETFRAAISDKATDQTVFFRREPPQHPDDLLTLGNTMTKFLPDLLDMGETTIPGPATDDSISQYDDTEVLDMLGKKLDRIRSSIQDTRDGFTKLKDQMSHPPRSMIGSPRTGLHLDSGNDSNQQSDVEAETLQNEEQEGRMWPFNWW